MASFDPTILVETLETLENQSLCPNRVWQACSQIKDWSFKQSTLGQIVDGAFLKDALRHEDHTACSIDFCEFSSRNFTAVQQYHEPNTIEESDQANETHIQKGTCFPLKNLFPDAQLIRAVESNRLTVWNLDGRSILEHPRPFMAISHVWSDGTGAGTWPSKQVHQCLYGYFKRIAERFQCEGIWWDTICVPSDRSARSKALSIMHRNYEYARVTVVHDRFLRNIPFDGPEKACLAIVLSSWFTRGWTALELAKSRKVKIIFKDSIKDLDNDILVKAQAGSFAAKTIKDLRREQFSHVRDLLATLGPRYISWLKDRATIAGLLAGIHIPDTNKDTFQQSIYQAILKKMGAISHDHLFHKSITMPGGFSWCASNLFHLPQVTTEPKLRINEIGEVSGSWRLISVNQLDPNECFWGQSHELIEAKLRYGLENESGKHILLVKPPEDEPSNYPLGNETKQGILVKVRKDSRKERTQFKCQFIGSLYFPSIFKYNEFVTREVTIGDTEGWEELSEDDDVSHIMKTADILPADDGHMMVEEELDLAASEPDTLEWTNLHRAAWLDDATYFSQNDIRSLLEQQDKLGRRAIHLAAERGHANLVKLLLDNGDNPNSLINSEFSDSNGQTPLHRAAWGGCLKTVELLLGKEGSPNATDEMGRTALHIAAQMGFGEVVERLCKTTPVEVQARNCLTPLHYAALGGHCEVAELLIAREDLLNVKDREIGVTPLHCAAENGQTVMIDLLLRSRVNVDETDNEIGWTPLHLAAMNGHNAAVRKLIKPDNINKEDKCGFTPLTFAAINGHIPVIQTLISRSATVGNDKFRWTPEDMMSLEALTEWLTKNRQQLVAVLSSMRWTRFYLGAMDKWTNKTMLILNGVPESTTEADDVDEEGYSKNSASLLEQAAEDGRLDTVRLLKRIGADGGAGLNNEGYWTPLRSAAREGHDDVVRALFEHINPEVADAMLIEALDEDDVLALLQAGANVETLGWSGYPLLVEAVERKHERVVQALLDTGANTEVLGHSRRTPLFKAVEVGCEGILQALLEAGANVEARDGDGETPLITATRYNLQGPVHALLKKGANRDATDKWGDSALHIAVEMEHEGILRALLEAEADTGALDQNGDTPLHKAVRINRKTSVQILLEGNAETEQAEDTPLITATNFRQEGFARALLAAGANGNAPDANHNTPLHLAARTGQEGILQALLEAGANKNALNLDGETPLLTAVQEGQARCTLALLKAGANTESTDQPESTPLVQAIEGGHADIVQMLLDENSTWGIKTISTDITMQYALTMARINSEEKFQEIKQLLLQAGVDKSIFTHLISIDT